MLVVLVAESGYSPLNPLPAEAAVASTRVRQVTPRATTGGLTAPRGD
ncbi:hypothetical protein [Fischerella thermalis]|nr:hypothetical protein [Fischerella thermalis]